MSSDWLWGTFKHRQEDDVSSNLDQMNRMKKKAVRLQSKCSCLIGALVLVVGLLTARAVSAAAHTHLPHDPPPPPPEVNEDSPPVYVIQHTFSLTENWEGPVVITSEVTSSEDVIAPIFFNNCACAKPYYSDTQEKTKTHTVSVTGEATVGLKNGLALELIAKANAQITIGVGWEGSWGEKITVQYAFTMDKCTKLKYSHTIDKGTVSGSRTMYGHSWSCTDYDEDPEAIVPFTFASGTCDPITVTGTAVGFTNNTYNTTDNGACTAPPCTPYTCPSGS